MQQDTKTEGTIRAELRHLRGGPGTRCRYVASIGKKLAKTEPNDLGRRCAAGSNLLTVARFRNEDEIVVCWSCDDDIPVSKITIPQFAALLERLFGDD